MIDFEPSEEQQLIVETVRQFAQSRVEPQAMEHDEAGTFNVALLRELGGLGLLGITIPEADGGAGLDATAACIVHDELAYSDPGFTLGYLAHVLLFVNNFYWAADATQRKRYLPKVLTGEHVGAIAKPAAELVRGTAARPAHFVQANPVDREPRRDHLLRAIREGDSTMTAGHVRVVEGDPGPAGERRMHGDRVDEG